jgi:hypothetical protein
VAGVICIDEQTDTTAEPPVPTTRPPIQPREGFCFEFSLLVTFAKKIHGIAKYTQSA